MMGLRSRQLVGAVLFTSFLSGCTVWTRDDAVLLQPVPERKQVEIDAGSTSVIGHSVRADSVTLSYVPFFKNPACDSCRVVLPRASVDSVRVKTVSAPRTIVLVAGILGIFWLGSQLPADDGSY